MIRRNGSRPGSGRVPAFMPGLTVRLAAAAAGSGPRILGLAMVVAP